jgi:NAD(P)-dependent dehydrogenase (short-subunit alcohol dehydrogenase family)
MDLGIAGKRAYVVAAADRLGAACAQALLDEGVQLSEKVEESDIVVAHAAPTPPGSLLAASSLHDLRFGWSSVVAAVDLYRRAADAMAARGWGRLVWVGSAVAKSVNSGEGEIDAVLSLGMMGLHKVVTAELAASNVTANTVLRGGSAGDTEVADAVVFLCSQGAGYLSGATITVDGGLGAAMF